MLSFHDMSSLLFASLAWYVMTEGTFQFVVKDSASSTDTGRTRKSLKRCHWPASGASG
jgi:hypothetical protein